jgi:hypothetical protein
MGIRYSDIESFTKSGLAVMGYSPVPPLNPGPITAEVLQKRTPGQMVFLQLGGGAGLNTEQLFDQPFITVRTIGKQHDFNSAEQLAWDIDTLFLRVNSNAVVGTAKVLYITRTGAGPDIVDRDDADRTHYQCTYITNAQTGL